MAETRVIVCKNGEANGAEIGITHGTALEDILQRATDVLRLPDKVTRLYKITGEEIKESKNLDDGEFIFASTGEDFIPVGGSSLLAHSSSGDEELDDGDKMDQGPIGFKDLPPDFQEFMLHNLEEGEEVKWAGRPVVYQALLKNLFICLCILGFAGLMTGLIGKWRVLIFNFSVALTAVLFIMFGTSTIFHEFYAVTNRRIIILHSGCLCNFLWCKRDVKKCPVFSKLTNFNLEIEEQFGLQSVFFRSTKLGFTNLRNGNVAAKQIKMRLPEAPPKTQIMF